MKRVTKIEGKRIETFGLSKAQHEIVVDMVESGKQKKGNYTLSETDTEVANVWISDAHSEGDEEYAEFLRNAIAESSELYVLNDNIGYYSQPIGDVAVFTE